MIPLKKHFQSNAFPNSSDFMPKGPRNPRANSPPKRLQPEINSGCKNDYIVMAAHSKEIE
ncbi:MAG TPA: hypothetical protein DEO84_03960 [candidate division Zixibacteria bacterium]|nr:hypothetical protein [candidate division Zixibacteria bacterium]